MLNNEIHIGIENQNHNYFDDLEKMDTLAKPITISMIKIQYTKERILGIKIKYRGMDGKTIVGQSSRKFKVFGVYFEKFKIDKGDCIQEIYGYANTTINQLGFKTYKGQKVICGSPIGSAFSYYIPNHTFIAAKGSHDQFLEYLSFRIIPLTKEQITQLVENPQTNKVQSFQK
ncbi:unnamed protein product [Paramecium primaurelia]|uniref:Jacalin-type lectin domain-containing protein n=1 Tax=Paramecium primaurelia TaxID=5886 RepID=A0A8S1KB51_PARPR|nr:unnamed protein product [Paramecium primaurelia]